eukprot:CAMPEP_0194043910 /NCGR_PEP_ID=MMETSP0009_2-20130614/15474_1 /TAXON_ID=210454 /ORGANISM="Grammatophora oceanica, Strain CCMP 410" /LENGTH=61 /DNA_ID=CAMNT_0038688293 /DNA_START=106 /DNA_END=288 /DNA_ORIENTATION=-
MVTTTGLFLPLGILFGCLVPMCTALGDFIFAPPDHIGLEQPQTGRGLSVLADEPDDVGIGP